MSTSAVYPGLPPHAPGMRIGLFGGSFNPAHEGHALVSRIARKRLRLDRVWWLVTPGNPLKDVSALPPQAARMAQAARVAADPRVAVSGIEARIATRFTYDTLRQIVMRCPGVHFVWIMGADNLRQFHRWQNWRAIAALMPIAVIDRPGSTLLAARGRAGQALARWRVPEHGARALAGRKTPALLFVHGPRSSQSSTRLRTLAGKKATSR